MRIGGPIALAGCFAGMFIWTWGTWPDVLVDFGRELYVPWRLSEGDVLYRDISVFYGPLSKYVNALWFSLFGVGLRTLVWCNAVIAALFTALMYRMFLRISGSLAATAACLVFILLFAFDRFWQIGNYNFISPYAHEATHGLILSLTGIFCLMQYQQSRSIGYVALAGLSLGLVFLTKLEPLIAAAPAIIGGLAAILWIERGNVRRSATVTTVFVAAALVPPVASALLLATAMPMSLALRGTLGSWMFLFNDELRSLRFFRENMGTDNVTRSLGRIAVAIAWHAMFFGPGLCLAACIRHPGKTWIKLALAFLTAMSVVIGMITIQKVLLDIMRPLPLIMAVIGAALTWRIVARRLDPQDAPRLTASWMIVVFAGLLLIKMLLFAKISHYGFALALPATLVLVALLVGWLPALVARHGGSAAIALLVSVVYLALLTAAHLRVTAERFDRLVISVGDGPDQFMAAKDRGEAVPLAVSALRQLAGPGDTLVALPEGVMLNYLARLPFSEPYLTFLPSDLVMFGADRMFESLRHKPPTFIAVVPNDASVFGARFFGTDYATQIAAWIDANYAFVKGCPELHADAADQFSISILMRRDLVNRNSR